jgi:hypothetical protein
MLSNSGTIPVRILLSHIIKFVKDNLDTLDFSTPQVYEELISNLDECSLILESEEEWDLIELKEVCFNEPD